MNKLFGLFLLALACWVPSAAYAVGCFWVGGSATWDNVNTGGGGAGGIKWASAAGGGTACAATSGPAAGVPGPSDTATVDANVSGLNGGTITVSGATISISSMSIGTANGTINFGTNNVTTNIAGTGINNNGSGTRTINFGSGTFTFANGGSLDNATQTNCTSCVYSNAPLVFSGNIATRSLLGGGASYNSVTVNSNSTKGWFQVTGANTIASMTVADGNTVLFQNGVTNTITGVLAMTGTASAPVGMQSTTPVTAIATVSVGSASTITWGSILRMTKSGAGTLDASCSFDLGGNTSFTSIAFVAASCGAAGGGGRIIGG